MPRREALIKSEFTLRLTHLEHKDGIPEPRL